MILSTHLSTVRRSILPCSPSGQRSCHRLEHRTGENSQLCPFARGAILQFSALSFCGLEFFKRDFRIFHTLINVFPCEFAKVLFFFFSNEALALLVRRIKQV